MKLLFFFLFLFYLVYCGKKICRHRFSAYTNILKKTTKSDLSKFLTTQKFIAIFFATFFLLLCTNTSIKAKRVYAFSSTYYAQVVSDNIKIYSSPDNLNPIFNLPKTYFVELISKTDQYYYARYDDVYGYVLKQDVKPIIGTPTYPFLMDISFRVFVPSGANMRSTPYDLGANNLVYSVPFLETNLSYYGTLNGEEAISKKGTVWYYCKYYVNNLSYTGYIYAPLCDLLTTITNSDETFEFYQGELEFENSNPQTNTQPLSEFSPTLQTIIIVVVSLPCLLFIYLLFKPTQIAEKSSSSSKNALNSSKKRKKISRLRGSDYFELDDDFN